jgi:plastocyanin
MLIGRTINNITHIKKPHFSNYFLILSAIVLLSITILTVVSFQQSFASADVSIPSGTSTPGCELEIEGCFRPVGVTIKEGEVTWTNDDSASHTVTSGYYMDGPDGLFDSGLLMPGETFSYTFDESKAYNYFCTIHPWMHGIVFVIGSDDSAPDDVEDDSSDQSTVYTNLNLDLRKGTENSQIQVYPTYTDDSGNELVFTVDGNEKFIELYIDEEYITSVAPNKWSDDIQVGVGRHEIYARSPESVNNNSKMVFTATTSNTVEIEIIGTQIGSPSLPPNPSSVGPVQIVVEPSIPVEGEEMPIHVTFTDSDGNLIEHINYDIDATQDGTNVLSESGIHIHIGDETHYTDVLTSDSPVDIQVTVLGIGLPDEEENWSVPPSATISWQAPTEMELSVDDNSQTCEGHFGPGFYYDEFEDVCLPPSGSWDDPGVDYMNQQCQDRYMSGFYYDVSENACLPPSGSWDDPGVDYMNQQCQDRFGPGIYYDYSQDSCLPPTDSWYDFTNNVSSYGILYGAAFYSGETPEPILITVTEEDGVSYDEFIIPGEALLYASSYDWDDISQTITDSDGIILSKVPMAGFYRIQIDDASQLISNFQQKPYRVIVTPNAALSPSAPFTLNDILDPKTPVDFTSFKNPDPTAPVILAVLDDFAGYGVLKEPPHGIHVVDEIQTKAPRTPIMPIQFSGDIGTLIPKILYATELAKQHNQKIVFNLSWAPKLVDKNGESLPGWEQIYSNFIKSILTIVETTESAKDGNLLFFAAAGNDNQDIAQPLQEVMDDPRFGHLYKKMYTVVGQVDNNFNPMSYDEGGSNYDSSPMGIIYDYSTESACEYGTSCTTPNVAATAATIWTARPSSSSSEIKNAIHDSAIVNGVHQILNPQNAYNYLAKCLPICDQIKYKTDSRATKDLPLTRILIEHPPKALIRTVSISDSKLPPVIHIISGGECKVDERCEIKIATATGGSSPYHFELDTFANGAPPLGMVVKTGKDLQSAYLSGTPSREGEYKFGVCAVDTATKSSCDQVTITVGEEESKPVHGGYDGQYTCDTSFDNRFMGSVSSREILSCSSGSCYVQDIFVGTVDSDGYFTGSFQSGPNDNPIPLSGKFSTTNEFTIKGSARSGVLSMTMMCVKR